MLVALDDDQPDLFVRVEGTFYRGVSEMHRASVLAGSHAPGRYSRRAQPTLYMSATREGVRAALQGHPSRIAFMIVPLAVQAAKVFDLRNDNACKLAGVRQEDGLTSWQGVVRRGGRAAFLAVA